MPNRILNLIVSSRPLFCLLIACCLSCTISLPAFGADFDADAQNVWLSPSTVYEGQSADIYARFKNLSSLSGPHNGYAQFDLRIIVYRPSGGGTHRCLSLKPSSGDSYQFSPSQTKDFYWENYTFSEAGQYTIKAEIWNNSAYPSWSTTTSTRFDYRRELFTIEVQPNPPTVSRNSPNDVNITIKKGQSITFKANGYDSDANLSGAAWYGNGDNPYRQWVSDVGGNGTSATFYRTHTFNSIGGPYAIGVEVFDTKEAYSDTITWSVTVIPDNEAPTLTRNTPPQENIQVIEGQSITFKANGYDNDANLSGAAWYGNGDNPYRQWVSDVGGNATSATFYRTHTFNSVGGPYAIGVEVFDTKEAYSDTITWSVTVIPDNEAPTLTRNTPPQENIQVIEGQSITFKANGYDNDANLSGAAWYGNGDNPYRQWVSDVGGNATSATFYRTHTFNSLGGPYAIGVEVFDTKEAYSDTITWSVTVISKLRGMYVDGFENILGDSQREKALLEYAKNNGIKYLALYSLHLILDQGVALADFIQSAKSSYGIVQVGACGSTEAFFDAIASLNDTYSCGFDVLNLEYEYWNHNPRDFSAYKSLLQHMNDIATQQGLLVEAYIGWSNEQEAQEISTLVDRLLLHCYVQDPDNAFNYARDRLSWLADPNEPIEVWPLYSAEDAKMGPWLKAHSMAEAEDAFMADYHAETADWKYGVGITGFQYFTYSCLNPAGNSAPIASETDLSNQPEAMYPNLEYSISAKYYDADGRDDLHYCYLRLHHPTGNDLTMMWDQDTGDFAAWALQDGADYLSLIDVQVSEIADSSKGYELIWTFSLKTNWQETNSGIQFGVYAEDDGGLGDGWNPDGSNTSFSAIVSRILSVPYYNQDDSKWCAITSLSMILKYYGNYSRPWFIAMDDLFKWSTADGMSTTLFEYLLSDVITAYLSERDIFYDKIVWDTSVYQLGVTFRLLKSYLINQLNKGRPIWLGMSPIDHAVVIVGYDEDNVYVNDPAYDDLASTFLYGHIFTYQSCAKIQWPWTQFEEKMTTWLPYFNYLGTVVLLGDAPTDKKGTIQVMESYGGSFMEFSNELQGDDVHSLRFTWDGRSPWDGYKYIQTTYDDNHPEDNDGPKLLGFDAIQNDKVTLHVSVNNPNPEPKTWIIKITILDNPTNEEIGSWLVGAPNGFVVDKERTNVMIPIFGNTAFSPKVYPLTEPTEQRNDGVDNNQNGLIDENIVPVDLNLRDFMPGHYRIELELREADELHDFVYLLFDVAEGVDDIPPTPNPMTWSLQPYETSTSSISMLATTADDDSPPVSYFFNFTNSPTNGLGGDDSAWQPEPSYIDSGLQTNHEYGYRVYARDANGNTTDPSPTISSYDFTDIETPSGVTFGAVTSSSVQVKSTNSPSGLDRGSSGLKIYNVTSGTDSGWKQNNDYWTSGSLLPNTRYGFSAEARNGDADKTGTCATSYKYTSANIPGSDDFSNVTQTSIRANWTANGNPAGTEYWCENITLGTNSGWITNTYWYSGGLECGTSYAFRVKAINGDGFETNPPTELGSQSTLKCPEGKLSVTPSDGLTSSGDQGGPFSPISKTYTLENTGDSSIDWTASKNEAWVTLSSTGDSLASGASTTVTVSINSNADSLAPGSYSDTVSFTNTTNGNDDTARAVSLNVNDKILNFATNTDSMTVSEGGTNTFEVKLSAQPSSTVTASVTRVNGDSDITVQSGATLTFTTTNYDNFQTVTLEAAEDSDTTNGTATIRVSASGIPDKDVAASEVDNDTVEIGLVAHWKMDEASWDGTAGEVQDSSGEDNHGTSYGAANTVLGKIGNSGSFDGVNDYVQIQDDDSLDLTEDFSIGFWLKILRTGLHIPLSKRFSDGNGWFIKVSSTYVQFNADNHETFNPDLPLDEWFSVVLTYDRSLENLTCYIDGSFLESKSLSIAPLNNEQNLFIGSENSSASSRFLHGSMDEVRIYNRALSEAEIQELYSGEEHQPEAVNDSYSTDEDTQITVPDPGVLTNDSDVDGDPLTAVLDSSPGHGSLTLNPDGSFTYTPSLNFNGNDSFTYHANDGGLDSNVATVTITVNPINDLPLVTEGESTPVAMDEDGSPTAFDLTLHATDADGDTITWGISRQATHGTAAAAGTGGSKVIDYVPEANWNGVDNFDVQVSDGNGGTDIITVNVTVNPVNDAPGAVNDNTYSTDENAQLTVAAPGVLSNDSDVDGDLLTAVLDSGPTNGTLVFSEDGSFIYIPNAQFNGEDSFTYHARDGALDSNVANVTIQVSPIITYTISGHVRKGGTGLAGVLMAGLPGNPVTETDGSYEAVVPDAWSGTVEPQKNGHSFEPPARDYVDVIQDYGSHDFAAFGIAVIDVGLGNGRKGGDVTIPITLTNVSGVDIAALSVDIGFDNTILENPRAVIGPAGDASSKDLITSLPDTGIPGKGVLRIGVLSVSNNSPIISGVVAYATFTIKSDVSAGETLLTNTPSASNPLGGVVEVDGLDGGVIFTDCDLGDCDCDGTVIIAEVQSGINMFLGILLVEDCLDWNYDNIVSISEVQKTINNFLDTGLENPIAESDEVPMGLLSDGQPALDLGRIDGSRDERVKIPVTLTNVSGNNISAVSMDIAFDSGAVENPSVEIGPAGSAADKTTISSEPSPGTFRIGVLSMSNNDIIGDGIVAYVNFNIKPDAAKGDTVLGNTPSASDPLGNNVPLEGADGMITVDGIVAMPWIYQLLLFRDQ